MDYNDYTEAGVDGMFLLYSNAFTLCQDNIAHDTKLEGKEELNTLKVTQT